MHLIIGIIGDYDGRPSHIATENSLKHCEQMAGVLVEIVWLPTESFVDKIPDTLYILDGLWCAPGSPYKSMQGAMNAIRCARENNIPFIGTCGGFQHSVLEFGRDVLQINELQKENFDLYLPNDFITPLSCSLVGQSRHIMIDKNSIIYDIYSSTEIEEKYNCSFGVNREFQSRLIANGYKVVGVDETGEARIMLLQGNSFYVATLFQPQLSSTYDEPHPLIMAYIVAVKEFHENRKFIQVYKGEE